MNRVGQSATTPVARTTPLYLVPDFLSSTFKDFPPNVDKFRDFIIVIAENIFLTSFSRDCDAESASGLVNDIIRRQINSTGSTSVSPDCRKRKLAS